MFKASLMRCTALAVLASFACAGLPAMAQEDATDDNPLKAWLGFGANYSNGSYGDPQDTAVYSTPLSLKFSKGSWTFRVSVPYVRVDGPGSLIDTPQGRDGSIGGNSGGSDDNGGSGSNSGSGSSGSGSNSGSGSSGSNSGSGSSGSGSSGSGSGSSSGSGSGAGTATGSSGTVDTSGPVTDGQRSGLGDVNLAATYSFELGDDFYADVTGRVKLPTASVDDRLSTGLADYTLGVDFIKDIGDFSVYAGVRRRFNGNDDDNPLRDVWGAGIGASYFVSSDFAIGVDYDWQQSSFRDSGASSEVSAWASFALAEDVRMVAYAGTGLSDNSADINAGLSLSWRFQ